MSYGNYYRCDSCGQIIFDTAPFGWIGLTRAEREGDGIAAKEEHACNEGCAQRLLMTTIQPATAMPGGPATKH